VIPYILDGNISRRKNDEGILRTEEELLGGFFGIWEGGVVGVVRGGREGGGGGGVWGGGGSHPWWGLTWSAIGVSGRAPGWGRRAVGVGGGGVAGGGVVVVGGGGGGGWWVGIFGVDILGLWLGVRGGGRGGGAVGWGRVGGWSCLGV